MNEPVPCGPEWYVVHAKPFHEKRVSFHLHRRVALLEVFVPLIQVTRRRRKHKWTLLQPLFPGYLFATMPHEPAAWTAVRWTPGVKRILAYGDVPVPVPHEFIAEIKARVAEFGFIRPGMPFKAGERVRLRAGPFAGLEGIFDRQLSPSGRVRILLEVLARVTPTEVDVLDLVPF